MSSVFITGTKHVFCINRMSFSAIKSVMLHGLKWNIWWKFCRLDYACGKWNAYVYYLFVVKCGKSLEFGCPLYRLQELNCGTRYLPQLNDSLCDNISNLLIIASLWTEWFQSWFRQQVAHEVHLLNMRMRSLPINNPFHQTHSQAENSNQIYPIKVTIQSIISVGRCLMIGWRVEAHRPDWPQRSWTTMAGERVVKRMQGFVQEHFPEIIPLDASYTWVTYLLMYREEVWRSIKYLRFQKE